jgi:hypothetical protein
MAPRDDDKEMEMEESVDESPMADMGGDYDDAKKDTAERGRMRQFYQQLDKTQEWAENNYYHLPIESQLASLVTINAFWRDYAKHRGKGPFLSSNLAFASRNFTEMIAARPSRMSSPDRLSSFSFKMPWRRA